MDKVYLKDHGFLYAKNAIPNFSSPGTVVANLGTIYGMGNINYNTYLTSGSFYQIGTFGITNNNDTIRGPVILFQVP